VWLIPPHRAQDSFMPELGQRRPGIAGSARARPWEEGGRGALPLRLPVRGLQNALYSFQAETVFSSSGEGASLVKSLPMVRSLL